MPWNPWSTFEAGNFYPENGVARDSLAVAVAASVSDSGAEQDTNNSFPGLLEGQNVGRDVLSSTGFSVQQVAGADNWDDRSINHLEVHFSTVAARDAYAVALAGANTPADVAAIVKNYKDNAVGGYWGTIGVAL